MLRRRKLLNSLEEVNLSPEEAQELMQRVESNTCSGEDRDRLATVIRATTQATEQLLDSSPLPERSSPKGKTKRKRQLAKSARRRNRR